MSVIGGSALLQSPLRQSFPSYRKSLRKKRASDIASFHHSEKSSDESRFFRRKVVFLVGVSAIPFLQLRYAAAKEPVKEKIGISKPGSKYKDADSDTLDHQAIEKGVKSKESGSVISASKAMEKETNLEIKYQDSEAQTNKTEELKIHSQRLKKSMGEVEGSDVGNSFVSFLNGIGIIGSGVLSALLAASHQDKKASESTIDSMQAQINDREMAINSMKEAFEATLSNEQEEHKRQLKMLKDDKDSLSNQLTSAKNIVAALGRELQEKKRFFEELTAQRGQLEDSLTQAHEDKKFLEDELHEKADKITTLQDKLSLLSLEMIEKAKKVEKLESLLAERDSLLTERESKCENLSSFMEQAKEDLEAANSCIEQLKGDIFKARDESNLKALIINDLHEKIKSLTEEKDDFDSKFHHLLKEYNDLISYSERNAAISSELALKKDEQLQQLEENLQLALSEASRKETILSELIRERDQVNALLEKGKDDICKLTNELQSSEEQLATSKEDIFGMSIELREAETVYAEVLSKFSKMEDEHDQTMQLLNNNLEEAKENSKNLLEKLELAMAVLKSTEEELVSVSSELKTVVEEREILKIELADAHRKVEATADMLKEESKIVSNLNKELEALCSQFLKDSEARKSLEVDLDEATRSLDEMNKSALLLSRELENTNSRNASTEAEKEILYNSLIEQKNIAKSAHESIEDAQNLIMRLGGERANFEKRSKRLEEELAAAKGEILRLRRKISMTQDSLTENHLQSNKTPAAGLHSAKRNAGRRKKQMHGSDDS